MLTLQKGPDEYNIWTYGTGFSIFDGKTFTNYTEKNGLQDPRIWDVDIDSKNNIGWPDGSGVANV